MNYVFVTLDEKVLTWRSGWPVAELQRRGYNAMLSYQLEADPPGETTYVLHIINRAWGYRDGRLTVSFLDVAKMLKQAGRLILTFDDDWTRGLAIQPRPLDPGMKIAHDEIPRLVKTADKVIVATPRLAEVFGKWAREIHVCENTVPEWVLNLPRLPRQEHIAWMGEMHVHGLDWNLLQPYARDLPPLRLIGSGQMAADRIRSWGAREVTATDPIFDQRRLYTEMSGAVAALIPLDDTPFNRGKSWSKPMEFMARAVQPIASWHPEYERLDEKTGALPTYEDPADLVKATVEAWDNRATENGDDLPDRLRNARLTMETGGGDQWEAALA